MNVSGVIFKISSVSLWFQKLIIYVHFLNLLFIPQLTGIVRHTSLIGKKVTLACKLTSPDSNELYQLVLWYKDDSNQPLYSLDARLNKTENSKVNHVVHDAVRGRAFFNMISDLAFLEISDVKEQDGGVYTCRVDFRKSRTTLYKIELFVIVPPPLPIITDLGTGEIIRGVFGPYNEGDDIKLRCTVKGGNPPPDVIWLKNDYVYDKTYKRSADGSIVNELILKKVGRTFMDSTLACQASNNNVTAPTKAFIKPFIYLYPLKTRILLPQRPLTANKVDTLTCKSSGSKPPAVISWYMDEEHLKEDHQNVTSDNGTTTISDLTFLPTAEHNGRIIRCIAINPKLNDKKIWDQKKLNVYYIPKITARLGNGISSNRIREGGSVFLECAVDANPRAIHFNWYFNNMKLETNNSSGILVANRTLILKSLKAFHRGNYTCAAVNRIGHAESQTVVLNIKHAPICSSSATKVIYASENETLKIPCSVIANPSSVDFSWWFRSNITNHQRPVEFEKNNSQSIATHEIKNIHDYGRLYCWAKNEIGDQHKPCVAEIHYARVPEAVQNCSFKTNGELEVMCFAGDDGGLSQSFFMEIYEEGELSKLLANISALDKPYFTIEVESKKNLVVKIYSFNEKGRGESLSLYVHSVADNNKLFGLVHLSLVNPVTGGIICAAVLLIMTAVVVLVLMVRKRRTRQVNEQKIYQKKQMSADIGTEDCSETEKKSPDIIPPSGLSDPLERKRLTGESDTISKKVSFRNDSEITFVELDIPPLKESYEKLSNIRNLRDGWLHLKSDSTNTDLPLRSSPRTFAESEV